MGARQYIPFLEALYPQDPSALGVRSWNGSAWVVKDVYSKTEVDNAIAAIDLTPYMPRVGTGPQVMQANSSNRGLFIRDKDTVASNEASNVLFGVRGLVGHTIINSEGVPATNLLWSIDGTSIGLSPTGLDLDAGLIRWRRSPFGAVDTQIDT